MFFLSLFVAHSSPTSTRRIPHPSLLVVPGRRTTTVHFTQDDSAEVQRLYDFLESQECEALESLAIGWTSSNAKQGSLRGLFAKDDFDSGDYVLALPFTATLLVQERILDPDGDKDNSNEEDFEIEQAVAFLQNFVSQPHWKPFIDCLPRVDDPSSFDATPDFWTLEALQACPVPRLRQASRQRLQRLQATCQNGHHSLTDLQWALWIMRSRGFTSLKQTLGKMRERTILLPLIDMINHDDNDPNVSIEVIETDVYEESFVALQAQHPIGNGEQLLLRYGTGFETSIELLDRYGFYTEGNPNDSFIDWNLVETEHLADTTTATLRSGSSANSDPSVNAAIRFREHLRALAHANDQ